MVNSFYIKIEITRDRLSVWGIKFTPTRLQYSLDDSKDLARGEFLLKAFHFLVQSFF